MIAELLFSFASSTAGDSGTAFFASTAGDPAIGLRGTAVFLLDAVVDALFVVGLLVAGLAPDTLLVTPASGLLVILLGALARLLAAVVGALVAVGRLDRVLDGLVAAVLRALLDVLPNGFLVRPVDETLDLARVEDTLLVTFAYLFTVDAGRLVVPVLGLLFAAAFDVRLDAGRLVTVDLAAAGFGAEPVNREESVEVAAAFGTAGLEESVLPTAEEAGARLGAGLLVVGFVEALLSGCLVVVVSGLRAAVLGAAGLLAALLLAGFLVNGLLVKADRSVLLDLVSLAKADLESLTGAGLLSLVSLVEFGVDLVRVVDGLVVLSGFLAGDAFAVRLSAGLLVFAALPVVDFLPI